MRFEGMGNQPVNRLMSTMANVKITPTANMRRKSTVPDFLMT